MLLEHKHPLAQEKPVIGRKEFDGADQARTLAAAWVANSSALWVGTY